MRDWLGMLKRGVRKPPRVIAARVLGELRAELDRATAPRRARLGAGALLAELESVGFDALWGELALRPFALPAAPVDAAEYERICPGGTARILEAAADALAHRVDLLGSGKTELGKRIDWLRDFKTGHAWAPAYFRSIDYNNPERPSDVKVAWELSRLQWLIPAGQAYLLTRDERYAEGVRDVLTQWMAANPYAGTVNWSCTMEVALRILTWTWFFHVFHGSRAWAEQVFRERYLCTLYLHVEFTERHFERSDVNGNHCTADAAGLVFGGLFFGKGRAPQRWQASGWEILRTELALQVFPDGVDFEASVPYHRLVAELFLLPARYRMRLGLPVDSVYRERLLAMARFTASYARPDGGVPLWGDADDARALPMGGQPINDHRYLVGLVAGVFDDAALAERRAGPCDEEFWVLGSARPELLPATLSELSSAFPDGGFYILRSGSDYVFMDCGPIGLAGRGGHGHNDCLAFEAVLDGVALVSDCGAYLYTASYAERNSFRSTGYHNTPQIDGQEINRFIRPDYLWNMHYDAVPEAVHWEVAADHAVFVGAHAGYERLQPPVRVCRTVLLDFLAHGLYVADSFTGSGQHEVTIPLHLAPGVEVHSNTPGEVTLSVGTRCFRVWWRADSGYGLQVEDARVSRTYGLFENTRRLVWRRARSTLSPFAVWIAPVSNAADFEARVAALRGAPDGRGPLAWAAKGKP
ncbi:MAG: alginate lyase family protein [Rhodocyclaceae bacterium]|nr:alginate lyase family protein [Rhodocyclaceae bacterium]MBX3667279.1 alginate lyase family protein [Rhodocyclaceae bacterium]